MLPIHYHPPTSIAPSSRGLIQHLNRPGEALEAITTYIFIDDQTPFQMPTPKLKKAIPPKRLVKNTKQTKYGYRFLKGCWTRKQVKLDERTCAFT